MRRIAIVGSGPSGFYAAEALFKSGEGVQVDMFERLPTPFGLVRGGVAPDHGKMKRVTRTFDRIADNDNYAFLGNVMVGRDISSDELCRFYDAVVFACGAETDRRLGIPGEDLAGSHTATEFVGWYNGHPDHRDRTFDLSHEVAVVIGHGNVAVDVGRILAKTADELRQTDIAAHALDVLAESKIKEVHVIGRRGPVQAKFTTREVRELGDLIDCEPVVDPGDLELDAFSRLELDDPKNKRARKNIEALEGFAGRPASTKGKVIFIRFLRSAVELCGQRRIEAVILEKNALDGEPFHQRAVGTGETERLPCGVVFGSVGYRGAPIAGVPFDEQWGIFPNRDGRIIKGGEVVPRLYAAGWIKRGPTGIIGTNKPDSRATVAAVLDDLPGLAPCESPDTDAVRKILAGRGVRVITHDDWRIINAAEIERGRPLRKPREKFTRIEEILAVLDTSI